MPFTLAHPAAALPLHRVSRGRLPLSALVAGSAAPDFVYYAPFGVNGRYSHGVEGLLLFCVPAGLLAWLLFHVLLKRPLAALLPDRLFRRLPECVLDRNAWRSARFFPVLAALFLGAASHIIWDAFTHRHTVVAYDLTLLLAVVWSGHGFDLRLYQLLQHASSAAGLAVLLRALRNWALRAHALRSGGASLPAWAKAAVAAAVVVTAVSHGYEGAAAAVAGGTQHLAVRAAVRAVAAASMVLLLFCIAWHAVDRICRFRHWCRKANA